MFRVVDGVNVVLWNGVTWVDIVFCFVIMRKQEQREKRITAAAGGAYFIYI